METKFKKKFDFPLLFCKRCSDTVHDLDFHDIKCRFCKCFVPCTKDKTLKAVEAKYHDTTCPKAGKN